ncbi:hypothetical protein Goshw_009715, partial [Gossypium schwendimanii]|nr:hypothetical protein [Gossypium schwendimanii]
MIFNERVLIPFAAEAIACLQAIQAGLEMGLRRIVIEGDALSVIRHATSARWLSTGPLAEEEGEGRPSQAPKQRRFDLTRWPTQPAPGDPRVFKGW